MSSEGEDRRRLPLYRRLAFGTGHVLHVLAAAMWYPYNVTFFEKVLQLPAKSTGTIILVAQVVGAVSAPFVGMWSDQTRCKYGRRKVFHLLGVVAGAASFFFIWHDCLGCKDAPPGYKVLYYSSFAIVFQFGWAAAQIAQLSLIPELTTDKSLKVELISIRYAFTMASFLVIFGCTWGLLAKFNQSGDISDLSPDDKPIFWITALVALVIGTIVTMNFQLFIHEDSSANPPKLKWYEWLKNPRFYLVGFAFMSARIIILLPQSYLPLYLTETLKMDRASIAKGPLILFLSSFFMTFVVKRCYKTVGEKMTFFLGLVIVWGAQMWFWVKNPTNDLASHFNWSRDSLYGATVLLGAGGATVMVIAFTMVANLVGPYTGSSAFVYGWMLFGDRLSNGVTVKIIQQFQPPSGPSLGTFYRHVLVAVPFAATAIGMLNIALMLGHEWWLNQRPQWNIQEPTNPQCRVSINTDRTNDFESSEIFLSSGQA